MFLASYCLQGEVDLSASVRDKLLAFVEGDVARGSRQLPARVVVPVLTELDLVAHGGFTARSMVLISATLACAKTRFMSSGACAGAAVRDGGDG